MSLVRIEAPSTLVESGALSSKLSEEYAMAPAVPFVGRIDDRPPELPGLEIFDPLNSAGKDEIAQPREFGPKFKPNVMPNSETAPDRPCDGETAPDRPRDSETAPDRPSENSRRRILPLEETPPEGNARELGSQAMKNLEKYRQWLKAHPPNIKLL
jgi:hypothetical protein